MKLPTWVWVGLVVLLAAALIPSLFFGVLHLLGVGAHNLQAHFGNG